MPFLKGVHRSSRLFTWMLKMMQNVMPSYCFPQDAGIWHCAGFYCLWFLVHMSINFDACVSFLVVFIALPFIPLSSSKLGSCIRSDNQIFPGQVQLTLIFFSLQVDLVMGNVNAFYHYCGQFYFIDAINFFYQCLYW